MLTEVRSYALALWMCSKGHRPIDATVAPDGRLVFKFPPEAQVEFHRYNTAKTILDGLEAQARDDQQRGGVA